MTAQDKWRVEPGNSADDFAVVYESSRLIGNFVNSDIARSAVAAHNATREAEPVAWQWRPGRGSWFPADDKAHAKRMVNKYGAEIRPLYTRPAADPVAVVEKLQKEIDDDNTNDRSFIEENQVRSAFADEIIRALKETGHGK